MGKSFIMRMFIKKQVMDGAKQNFALIVPTKALINEVFDKITKVDLKDLLGKHNYTVIKSGGDLALKGNHNFIFVLTPERLLYLLIEHKNINIDYLFIDEAHKISSKDKRSAFYYKVVQMLGYRDHKPRVIFASPNIPNPEVYLKLIPNAPISDLQKLATSFSPVSQLKYLIDVPENSIYKFNSYTNDLSKILSLSAPITLCPLITQIGAGKQNIVYCSTKAMAVESARDFARLLPSRTDAKLVSLAKDIKAEVHNDYYLAEVISKGIAYHIGYLPSALRMRIEELFRDGLISTMFCTSTLVEGVNLPADNLFITNYKNGRSEMKPVEFKNLIGRVGRITYNLYGNVFLVRLDSDVERAKYEELLKSEVEPQKLSLVTELTKPQKKLIIETLLKGEVDFPEHPKNQSEDNYTLMRKFALILLRDIVKARNSLVKQAFADFLTPEKEEQIKVAFATSVNKPDDDINVSIDQMNNLSAAIANGDLFYPPLDANGAPDYNELMVFLEKLCTIFKWEKYESSTLGYIGKNGKHGKLRWYAVILAQWIRGNGLGLIMINALDYKKKNPSTGVKLKDGRMVDYDSSIEHENLVIADVLMTIDHIILFNIANYFLRFSNEYKRYLGKDSFPNDWYEYVEYGTTNALSIFLQRYGFSRETAEFIKANRTEYVVIENGTQKLKKSIASCGKINVENDVASILFNSPELFID
jgi:superfamily II DNA/RNA helicase